MSAVKELNLRLAGRRIMNCGKSRRSLQAWQWPFLWLLQLDFPVVVDPLPALCSDLFTGSTRPPGSSPSQFGLFLLPCSFQSPEVAVEVLAFQLSNALRAGFVDIWRGVIAQRLGVRFDKPVRGHGLERCDALSPNSRTELSA